ncbi:MAG: hypothetical protein KBT21_10685 [Treponema sp.]|nr:hypothetical protein [Candidatus Treponema merdequi]
MELPDIQFFDSLKIAKRTWPDFETHRLTDLGNHFNIKYNAHNALEDSRTCGQIIKLAADEKKAASISQLLSKLNLQMEKL